jgi:hypothetical protein
LLILRYTSRPDDFNRWPELLLACTHAPLHAGVCMRDLANLNWVYLQVLHALADLDDRAGALVSNDHGLVHNEAADVALQAETSSEVSAVHVQPGMSTTSKHMQHARYIPPV